MRRSGALVVAVGFLAACAAPAPGLPDTIVQGALRSSVEVLVAPAGYRSGLLSPALAAQWTARAEADLRQWYRGQALDEHLAGLHNIVGAAETQPGPIATSVDIEHVNGGAVNPDGDTGRVDEATIWYRTHYAPGTWNIPDIEGVTMCHFELRRVDGAWRVETQGCNVSGG